MYLLYMLKIIIVYFNIETVTCNFQESVFMINDLIKTDGFPTSLVVMNCWNVQKNLNFLKEINTPTSFISSSKFVLPSLYKANEIMFVVDTNCKNAQRLLLKVIEHKSQTVFSNK